MTDVTTDVIHEVTKIAEKYIDKISDRSRLVIGCTSVVTCHVSAGEAGLEAGV